MKKNHITPERLFEYAISFAKKADASGEATRHSTFRQASKHFKVTLDVIEDACESWQGDGYMAAAVGFRTGAGVASYRCRGDWLVEATE